MSLRTIDPVQRKRAWLSAALVFGALLIVPFLAWLILPAPPSIAIPQIAAATEAAPQKPVRRPIEDSPSPAPAETVTEKPVETAASVHGRVIGPDRMPVGRAWIGCTNKEINTTTEPDGTFELPALALGCSAIAQHPGFGASLPVTLRAGDERANTLELRAGGKIEGVVVDDQGAPIPKFMLGVEKFIGATTDDDEGPRGRARTVENEKGEFTMENMTPGKYVLSVSVEGRPAARTDLFEVEAGRTTSGIRVTVARGGTLTGSVTDAGTRRPIEGVRVALDMASFTGVSTVPSVTTDANGAYSLDGVPTGAPFSISVTKEGYRTRIVSGLNARGGAALTSDVQLTAKGEGTGDMEVAGIGAILGPAPDSLGASILQLIKDGPAEKGGLLKGDRIVRIDGTSADTLTLVECIQRLRGEAGTGVAIWVKRGDKEMLFNLRRANVVR